MPRNAGAMGGALAYAVMPDSMPRWKAEDLVRKAALYRRPLKRRGRGHDDTGLFWYTVRAVRWKWQRKA